jgi:transposase
MKKITNKSQKMLDIEVLFGGEIEEILRIRYVDENKSIQTIATELNLSYITVHKWLMKANITSRRILFTGEGT